MDSRKSDLIAAAAFLAGAAAMAYESFSEVYQASGAGVAHDAVFYPRIVLAAIVLLALLLAASALSRGRGTRESRKPAPQADAVAAPFGWKPVVAIVVATAVYAALMPTAGYLVSTLMFVAMVPPLLGFRRWKALALTVLLFPLASWLLFTRVIAIPLPAGVLSFLG